MKSIALLAAIALFATTRALSADQTPPPAAGTTTVNVPAAVSELAAGYAAAAQQMSLRTLVVYFRGDKDVVAIKGIRTVRAVNGVLLINLSAGDFVAVAADRVLLVTDGTRTP